MSYTIQDKREFFEKDAKYNIGMGVGNAFNKAVDYYLSDKPQTRGKTDADTLLLIEQLRDMFYKSNQAKIEQEIKNFLDANPVQQWYDDLKEKTQEIIEAEHPTIQQGIDV